MHTNINSTMSEAWERACQNQIYSSVHYGVKTFFDEKSDSRKGKDEFGGKKTEIGKSTVIK